MQTTKLWQMDVPEETVRNDYLFYCKLFDDMIVACLCSLRRRELNDRDRFSCRGCSKDTIINSPHSRLRAAAALRS